MVDLWDWLVDRVKLPPGDEARVNLFRKLVRLQKRHGLAVDTIVAECWLRAEEVASKKPPSHHFCKMVCLRLKEKGLYAEPSLLDGRTPEEIHALAFREKRAPLFDPANEGPPSPDVLRARRAILDSIGKKV